MKYLGGKSRINHRVAAYLESVRKPNQPYLEPFVGSGWVCSLMTGERYASDYHKDLIMMWQAIQQGWVPPMNVSEAEYEALRNAPSSALRGFVGFGCSFGGMFFSTYARGSRPDAPVQSTRNYAAESARSVLKKAEKMKDVTFRHCSYDAWNPSGHLIYCDPPYANTAGYKEVGSFDHDKFWETIRRWSENNTVVVSEYSAPHDFEIVAEFLTKTDLLTKNGHELRVEKMYQYSKHLVSSPIPRIKVTQNALFGW